jgi:hypothetical protein
MEQPGDGHQGDQDTGDGNPETGKTAAWLRIQPLEKRVPGRILVGKTLTG